MCRSCAEGGRRCPKTEYTRAKERAAARRYYLRSKAREIIALLRDAGIPAMDDLQCPPTYHLGQQLDLERAPQHQELWLKPAGLWTSPGRVDNTRDVRTAWADWCASEEMDNDNPDGIRQMFEIRPTPGAIVVRLETPADIRAFGSIYFHELAATVDANPAAIGRAWQQLQIGLDAVFLTAEGVRAAQDIADGRPRETDPAWHAALSLSSWDTASVCWFRNHHIQVHTVTGAPDVATVATEAHDIAARELSDKHHVAYVEGPCSAELLSRSRSRERSA